MTPRYSVYLDLVRALAALAVVFDHATTLFDLPDLPRWGHEAVIVFFVLSGLVISHVAAEREASLRLFLVARLARLWSVLVPAMALTMALVVIGKTFGSDPEAYAGIHTNLPLLRVALVLSFLSETWISVTPPANGVVWSLSAEFWYYALFAIWTFLPPGRWRRLALAVAIPLAGFKALLLLPIWLMGVALQRMPRLVRPGLAVSSAAFGIGGLAVACVLAIDAYDPVNQFMERLLDPWVFLHVGQARAFWFDWLFGLCVAMHLAGARRIAEFLPLERLAAGPIRWCAGVSFAAYLFHAPVLHCLSAFLPPGSGWLALTLTLLTIGLLGPTVERTKHWWRRQLNRVADLVPGRFWPAPGTPVPAGMSASRTPANHS